MIRIGSGTDTLHAPGAFFRAGRESLAASAHLRLSRHSRRMVRGGPKPGG